MNEEAKKMMGQNVYETICKMFDAQNYHYERHDEEHVITCTVRGDDLPMDIIFAVRDERQIVQLISPMPFTVPEDKRIDMALAITIINNMLVDGSFDFDMAKGRVSFRLTASYIESILGKELFEYMLMISATTVDEYNDKFFMLAKGMLSFEQFLENESK
ncbi:MAG: YbjN domain-containing protein [Lachnospiraceae bacterium]|nr:YbjN domain-containing protein [Lachnospiraceae bacterium]MCM1230481.1 YbjN domain-containing protein [Ruminococcus flavefaciens]